MNCPTYTIKPLAWEQDGDTHIANTPFGCLRVFTSTLDGTLRASYDCNNTWDWIGHRHESIEAAKQACTEQWEGMIKQALEEVCQ